MKKQIWKYPLKAGANVFTMPKGAEILTVQSQDGTPCVWALVNPADETEERELEVYGTGHDILCGPGLYRRYINTFQLDEGALVFHLFEKLTTKI